MRILQIAASNSTAGGGEKHVADCVREMTTRGHEVGLIAPEGGDLKESAEACGAAYFPVEIGHGISCKKLRKVRDVLHTFQPDIVHAHGHRAALFARLADKQAASRLAYTFHGIHVDKGLLAPVKLSIERLLRSRAAAFIATCRADAVRAERLHLVEPSKLHVIYNGVDAPRVLERGAFRSTWGIGAAEPLILSVGRISAPKNWPGMLRIFEKTVAKAARAGLPTPRLVMICPGTDAQFADLQRTVAFQRDHERILLLPRQRDLAPAYRDADVFALASTWEARAFVICEALSYQTPVVGYDIDGSSEAVDSGASGTLVALGDEDAFADALIQLLGDPEMRSRLGAHGAKEMARRFSHEKMTDELLALYQSIVSGN